MVGLVRKTVLLNNGGHVEIHLLLNNVYDRIYESDIHIRAHQAKSNQKLHGGNLSAWTARAGAQHHFDLEPEFTHVVGQVEAKTCNHCLDLSSTSVAQAHFIRQEAVAGQLLAWCSYAFQIHGHARRFCNLSWACVEHVRTSLIAFSLWLGLIWIVFRTHGSPWFIGSSLSFCYCFILLPFSIRWQLLLKISFLSPPVNASLKQTFPTL